jgi:hypothetical protein
MQISKKLYTTLIIAVLTMSAIMTAIPMASAEITVAPTLTPDSGAVGTEVEVSAGTNGASPFSTVSVYLDALSGTVLGTGSASATGSYSIDVEIPPTTAGAHYLVVNDGETESNGTIFTVLPRLTIQTVPETFGPGPYTVLPGDSVILTGDGFAANEDITITFENDTLPNSFGITSPSISTDATGSFGASVIIPLATTLADFGLYNVTAIDESTNNATALLNIDYFIMCTPASGPRGITTTISGRIAPNEAFTVRFNGAAIGTGTTSATGAYSVEYTIPGVLSEISYPVDILWNLTETRDTTFTVTASPTIVVNPLTGIVGATIDITGEGFIPGADLTLFFGSSILNTTADGFGPAVASGPSSGEIPADATFVVPPLSVGSYAITVVDQFGATSNTVIFSITATPVFVVETRFTSYVRMDYISLMSHITSPVDALVEIRMPSGLLFWDGMVDEGDWELIGGYYQIPNNVLDLTWWPIASDAPLGTWNFTIYEYGEGIGAILDTNLFEVMAKPTIQTVLDRLDTMEATITDVVTDAEGAIIAVVNTKAGQIVTNIANLDAKITSIDGATVTISTAIGEVQTTLSTLNMDALGADITAIKGDVATIRTNLGTVTTSVSSLNTKVTAIDGNLATLSTTVGTMDGKITALQGTTATIETDVGTLQADVGAVQADVTDVQSKADMTPVWIAVVLSLVAAIAAVFAVITIRQKIAG